MSDALADYVRLPIYRDQLARALNFTEADLQENRAGRLNDSQRSTLLRLVTRTAITASGLLCLAIVGLALSLVTSLAVLFFIPLVLTATLLGWVVIFALNVLPAWRDATAGVVSSVEGFVTPAERSRSFPIGAHWVLIWSYHWVVDGRERFRVPGNVYPVLTPARHRLYFVPVSRRIVAAEPIS